MSEFIRNFFGGFSTEDEVQDFRNRKVVFLLQSRRINARLRALRLSMHSTDAWTASAKLLNNSMEQVKHERLLDKTI